MGNLSTKLSLYPNHEDLVGLAGGAANDRQHLTTAEKATALQAGLGVGQTLTNVAASRAFETQYTNSTGQPIFVMATVGGAAPNYKVGVLIDGVTVTQVHPHDNGYTAWYADDTLLSFIVPAGSTYKITEVTGTGAIRYWWELR